MENKQFKGKTAVTLLAWISAALGVIRFVFAFIGFRFGSDGCSEIYFMFPDIVYLISIILFLLSAFLFAFYFQFCFSQRKRDFLFTVALGLITVSSLCETINKISFLYDIYSDYPFLLRLFITTNGINTLRYIILTVLLILAFIFLLKKRKNKLFVLISSIFGLAATAVLLFLFLKDMIDAQYLYRHAPFLFFIDRFAYYLSDIAFFLSLLIFRLKNREPAPRPANVIPENTGITAADELRILTKNYELGLISREEFLARREEIISRL